MRESCREGAAERRGMSAPPLRLFGQAGIKSHGSRAAGCTLLGPGAGPRRVPVAGVIRLGRS